MADPETPTDPRTDETPQDRVNRELNELLQGLRVALPGVQVLFAFLLTVPFASGFDGVGDAERTVFLMALVLAAIASVCLIAPAAQHRVLFRTRSKETLLRRSNRYGIAGALALGAAMSSAALFVVESLFDVWIALWTAGILMFLWSWAWFAQPLITRARNQP